MKGRYLPHLLAMALLAGFSAPAQDLVTFSIRKAEPVDADSLLVGRWKLVRVEYVWARETFTPGEAYLLFDAGRGLESLSEEGLNRGQWKVYEADPEGGFDFSRTESGLRLAYRDGTVLHYTIKRLDGSSLILRSNNRRAQFDRLYFYQRLQHTE